MIQEVILPKLGQTVEESRIVEWMKEEGDPVERGDVLFSIETDKAVLDVEATKKGYLRKILAPAGEVYPVLTVVALMTRDPDEDISGWGAAPAEAGPTAAEPEAAEPAPDGGTPEGAATAAEAPTGRLFVSPRARKAAEARGVDLWRVQGSGPNGRIVERDVLAYAASAPKATPVARHVAESLGVDLRQVSGTGPSGKITRADVQAAAQPVAAPAVEPAPPAPEPKAFAPAPIGGDIPLAGVRAVIAQRMHESHQLTAPVTLTMEVDATELVSVREKLKAALMEELGFAIGFNDLLIAIAARALRRFPHVNARLEGEVIRLLDAVHIGLAVDTDRGLLVPVIRDADRKGLAEIARDVRDLAQRTRSGKVQLEELTGSTFTITNLGMLEVDAFTPVINLPEIAILGVGRIKPSPAVVEGELCVRQMMWLSLTFDHRLVDGAPAARFMQYIKHLIEQPFLMLA